jgi:hypothetical protein
MTSGSLLLEVLIDGAALPGIAPRSAHRANDDFLVFEGDCDGRMRLLYIFWSKEGLRLLVWGGKPVVLQHKALYKSGLEAITQK